jgi:hypothetical protein
LKLQIAASERSILLSAPQVPRKRLQFNLTLLSGTAMLTGPQSSLLFCVAHGDAPELHFRCQAGISALHTRPRHQHPNLFYKLPYTHTHTGLRLHWERRVNYNSTHDRRGGRLQLAPPQRRETAAAARSWPHRCETHTSQPSPSQPWSWLNELRHPLNYLHRGSKRRKNKQTTKRPRG